MACEPPVSPSSPVFFLILRLKAHKGSSFRAVDPRTTQHEHTAAAERAHGRVQSMSSLLGAKDKQLQQDDGAAGGGGGAKWPKWLLSSAPKQQPAAQH